MAKSHPSLNMLNSLILDLWAIAFPGFRHVHPLLNIAEIIPTAGLPTINLKKMEFEDTKGQTEIVK